MNIKRRFNNDQTVDKSLGKPSIFAIDPSASSPDLGLISFDNDSSLDWSEIFNKNIELINHRISQLHKELSYWDLYKLTTQVRTPEELNPIFEGLLPGEALVINTQDNFVQNNETYAKGDVVLKLFDESAVIIKAVNAGIYKPNVDLATGTQPEIDFIFQSSSPTDDDAVVRLPITNFDASAGFIYGLYRDVGGTNSITFPIEKFTEEGTSSISIVYPYIRFFNEGMEEIFCDYELSPTAATASDDNYTVSWDASSPVKYIEVK